MTVFINGKGAHRLGDQTRHCGGLGQLIEGSPNVIVGESMTADVARSSSTSSATSSDRAAATRDADGGSAATGGGASLSASTTATATSAAATTVTAAASEPASAEPPPPPAPRTWIEVALVGEDGEGIAGAHYRLAGPDGVVIAGVLDATGRARLDGFAPGVYKVSFPDLDRDAWEPVHG